jgi:hypothetical protein
MEAIRSSEMSVLTKNTRLKFPEDGFLHSHRCGNLKSYSYEVQLLVTSYEKIIAVEAHEQSELELEVTVTVSSCNETAMESSLACEDLKCD